MTEAPHPVLAGFFDGDEESATQLWLRYQATASGETRPARVFQYNTETGEKHWVGDAFALPEENFEAVSPFRTCRANRILLSVCTEEELDALFEDVTIPFTLGATPPQP